MPTNDFNTGRDTRVVIRHPLAPGGRLDLHHVTGFHPKQDNSSVSVKTLAGERLSASLPDGWSGTVETEKANPNLDFFIDALETAVFNGVAIPPGQIFQYDTETNGSRTTWQFDKTTFHLAEAGSRASDAAVKQSLGWLASRRRRVA